MREIKFRAWWKTNFRMVDWEEIINVEGDFILSGLFTESNRFIPMQYTGLKDKNGKEIYEEDILENRNKKRYIMGFEDGMFDVLDYDNYGHDQMRAVEDPEEWEVVGNIYENPDLLKEK